MLRKALAVLLLCALTASLYAQQEPATREQLRRQLLLTMNNRDGSRLWQTSRVPIADKPLRAGAKSAGVPMPDSCWFPGEWEELQAVLVTPYYDYQVPGHEQSTQWSAVPLVPGYADYYYVNAHRGTGPYLSAVDTVSAMGLVFFRLMDAIQLGGAEVWVRIEQPADSAVVLRQLQRMGLRDSALRFFVAPGNTFWLRDSGPICFYYGAGDTLGMLDFEYHPGRALDDSLPTYLSREFGLRHFASSIEWEGGNCLVDGAGMLFTSDATYRANCNDTVGQYTWNGSDISTLTFSYKPRLRQDAVRDSLRRLLAPRALHVLPAFQYDGGTGHVDLYAVMLDENLFGFSRMPDIYRLWTDYTIGRRNRDTLCSHTSYFNSFYRSKDLPFPSKDNGSAFASQAEYAGDSRRGYPGYTRSYANHLMVNHVLVQPCFSAVGSDGKPTARWDRANYEQLAAVYPGYTIYPIDVRSFDGTGGAIHCISKQIPVEQPLRILHRALHGNTYNLYTTRDAAVEARITHATGIAAAKVVYRIDGGGWHMSPLSTVDNLHYQSVIATAGYPFVDYAKCEYYIEATAQNGKTMTKPLTAPHGGYYTFYLGENPSAKVSIVDAEEHIGQFYPNPTRGEARLWINLDGVTDCHVEVVDATGRTVQSATLKGGGEVQFTIATERLAAGIYNVVFSWEGCRVARKLLVE